VTRPVTRPEQRWWDDSIVLVASLLLARVTWEYMVILSLPCFLLWMRGLANGEVGPRQAVVVGLAYALCALPFPYTESPVRAGPGLLLESPRTYGMILLFVASPGGAGARSRALS
jgi:TRAP-type C4-dicarboxylate transport system permease large subunit